MTTMEVRQLRETRSHCRGRRATDDGMTIVELLIALVVVMVAFAALASTVIAAFSAIRSNEARVLATALGNELIEEMSTVPWPLVGLYEDDAQDTQFEGEFVVLIPEPADVADRHEVVPRAVTSINRDGRTYTVERWVTVQDVDVHLKRLIVIITWEAGGREHMIRTEGLRSPDPDDLLNLQVRFEELVNANSAPPEAKVELYPPAEPADPPPGPGEPKPLRNSDPIRAVVRVGIVEANVQLRFVDRKGDLHILTTSPTPGDEHQREFPIAANAYEFPHGNVDFTVVASGDGEVASHTAVLRFYQPLDVRLVEFSQENNPDNQQIEVCAGTSELAGEVTIEVVIWGMTAAEAIAGELGVDWGRVPSDPSQSFQPVGPAVALGMQQDGTTSDGGWRFRTTVAAGTPVGTNTNAFRVTAHRMVGDFDENENYIDHALDAQDRATTGRLGDSHREVGCP